MSSKFIQRVIEVVGFVLVLLLAACSPPQSVTPTALTQPTPAATSAAVQTPAGSNSQAEARYMLYRQDFESGTAGGWYVPAVGEWNILEEDGNHFLQGSGPDPYPQLWFEHGKQWTDYAFESRVRLIKGALFICLRTDHGGDTFYNAVLNGENGWVAFSDFSNNDYKTFKETTVSLEKNKWYTVRFEVEGEDLRLFLDDRLVISSTRSGRSSGSIGYYIGGGEEVNIDDIRVWSLEKEAASLPTLSPQVLSWDLPVAMNTPVPLASEAITADNLEEVTELAAFAQGFLIDAVYTPDGKRIIGNGQYNYFIFNPETLEIEYDSGWLNTAGGLAVSPDGKRLYLGAGYGEVMVRNLETHVAEATLPPTIGGLSNLTLSPDGRYLFVMENGSPWDKDERSNIRIFQASDLQLLNTLQTVYDWSLAVSPDGNLLACGGYGGLYVYKLPRGEYAYKYLTDGEVSVWKVAFSPDGSLLAILHDLGITIRRVSDWSVIQTLNTDTTSAFNNLEFSADGDLLLGDLDFDTLGVWRTDDWELVGQLDGQAKIARFAPDGRSILAISGYPDGKFDYLSLRQVSDGALVKISSGFVENDPFKEITLSPDGKYLGTSNRWRSGWIWNLATGDMETKVLTFNPFWFMPDGKSVIDDEGALFNVSDGMPIREPLKSVTDACNNVFLSTDGQYLVKGCGRKVELWQAESGRAVTVLDTLPIAAMAVSPDSERLLVASADRLQSFHLPDGKREWDVRLEMKEGESYQVDRLLFTPSGEEFIILDTYGHLATFNAASGDYLDLSELLPNPDQKELIVAKEALFSQDGRLLFTPQGVYSFPDGKFTEIKDFTRGQNVGYDQLAVSADNRILVASYIGIYTYGVYP